jgi:hypothetical protein
MENCGLNCNFVEVWGTLNNVVGKKKDLKMGATTTNYLEIIIDDEETVQC